LALAFRLIISLLPGAVVVAAQMKQTVLVLAVAVRVVIVLLPVHRVVVHLLNLNLPWPLTLRTRLRLAAAVRVEQLAQILVLLVPIVFCQLLLQSVAVLGLIVLLEQTVELAVLVEVLMELLDQELLTKDITEAKEPTQLVTTETVGVVVLAQ
jgi:hypothetical protein